MIEPKQNNITIEEYKNGYIIQYNGKNVMKWEKPISWDIVKEPCQIYMLKGFAESGVKSLKRYILRQYGGDFNKWENKYKEVK